MRVTIWDLDYYYSKEKKNCFNVDAMRISSFHKQNGDTINFVTTEYDIRRPYDLYYIIKEKSSTPNPPFDFYTNNHVRWWGNANRARINWNMDRVMLGCRPDYLLYPEKNTRLERSEYIRVIDNQGHYIPISQDYTNTFKQKRTIVVDKYMWLSSKKDIIQALNLLKEVQSVSFFEPIRIDILMSDEDIKNKFFELKLTAKSSFEWDKINVHQVDAAIEFLQELKERFPTIKIGKLICNYDAEEHWDNQLSAYEDFVAMKHAIITGRKAGIWVAAAALRSRLDTPYFHLFEELSNWTNKHEQIAWIEYLNRIFPYCSLGNPKSWTDPYRDLVRQTYQDKEFFLYKWKGQTISENEVPWELLNKEFTYGI